MSDGAETPIPKVSVPAIPKPTAPEYHGSGPPPIPKVGVPPIPRPNPPAPPKSSLPRIVAAPTPPPSPEGSAPPPKIRPVMAKARKLTQWEVLFRVIVVVFILASIGLAWWSYSQRFMPLQKQSRELSSANSALSTEVDAMY